MDMLWSLAEHQYLYIRCIIYSHVLVFVFVGTQGERQRFGWMILRTSTTLLCPQPVMCPMASKCVSVLIYKYYCEGKVWNRVRHFVFFNM